jgi:acetyl-CoA C-acetyltransferase
MRPVSIIGVGKTRFGVLAGRSILDLAVEAGRKCLQNGGVDRTQIEAFYLGNFAGPSFVRQSHLAPYIASGLNLEDIPATRFEDACASSGAAFYHAWSAVAGGLYDVVLVCGVEKMTCQPTARVTDILAAAGDVADEASAGATFPALFAMIARRHMHQFGTTREQMAAVAVKNHANGAMNPDAHMHKVITVQQALASRMIADPLTIYDCSLVSDGAAAVLLCAGERASDFSAKPIRVLGIAQASDRLALVDKDDITTFHAVRRAGEKAFAMAGLQSNDVSLAELHDCFTIAEIIALEDLGFFPRGEGGTAAESGYTALKGRLPVNTSGGLKSKGHPVGATGVGQICDLVLQMRCEAGERQVARTDIGLAQNLGGSGATCVVTILGK